LLGLVEAAVVEAFAILGPGNVGEFHPLDDVSQVLAAIDIAYIPHYPVGAGSGGTVSQQLAIGRNGVVGQRDGTIGGKRVGIQKHSTFSVQRIGYK